MVYSDPGQRAGILASAIQRARDRESSDYFQAIAQGEAMDQNDARNSLSAQQLHDEAANRAYFRTINAEKEKYARGINARDFAAGRDDAKANQAWHLGNLGVNQEKLNQTAALAQQEAMDGEFSPEKYAGVLTPIQIDQYSRMSARARIQPTQQYQYFKNIAGDIGRSEQLASDVESLKESQKTAPSEPGGIRSFLGGVAKYTPAGYLPTPIGVARLGARLLGSDFFTGPDENTPTKESIQPDIADMEAERIPIQGRIRKFEEVKPNREGVTRDASGNWTPTYVPPWESAYFSGAPTNAPAATVTSPAPSFGQFREGQIIYRKGVPYKVVNGKPVLMATQ